MFKFPEPKTKCELPYWLDVRNQQNGLKDISS